MGAPGSGVGSVEGAVEGTAAIDGAVEGTAVVGAIDVVEGVWVGDVVGAADDGVDVGNKVGASVGALVVRAVDTVTLRTLFPPYSDTYTLPLLSTATPEGLDRLAAVAETLISLL